MPQLNTKCNLAWPVSGRNLARYRVPASGSTGRTDHFRLFLATVVQRSLVIQAIFSFFGHFGVAEFVFLSAYGLSRSHWDVPPRWTAFIWSRVRKLYPAFLLVVIPWFVAFSLQSGLLPSLRTAGLELAPMLAGVSNFLPGYGLPPVGPWWFIPLIMQFCAIWPFMRKLTLKFGYNGLLALAGFSIILTYALNPLLLHWSINLMESPIGHMPSLCLGIIAARYPVRISPRLAALACAVVLLDSWRYEFWMPTFVCAAIASVGLYIRLRSVLRKYRWLEWLGQCSMLLFLLNGIVRDQFLSFGTSPSAQLVFGSISALVSLAIAAFMQSMLTPPRTAAKAGSADLFRNSAAFDLRKKTAE